MQVSNAIQPCQNVSVVAVPKAIPTEPLARSRKKQEGRVRFRNHLLWIGGFIAAAQACALTLGNPQNPVVLGAPLDVRITLTPDPDQTLESSCIESLVMFGDTLAPTRTELIAPHTIRIRTLQPANEPLVHLKVTAGCTSKLARSYTLFADPPELLQPPLQTPAIAPVTAPKPVAKRPAPAPKAKANKVSNPKPATAAGTAPAPVPTQKAPPPNPVPPSSTPHDPVAAAPLALSITELSSARPVLRMDTLFLFHDPDELTTTDRQQSLIPLAPTDTPPIDDQRLQQLETQLASLEKQQSKDRAEILALTTALATASATPLWLYLLLAALTAALLAIAYLLQRLRTEHQQSQNNWGQAVRNAQAKADSKEKTRASYADKSAKIASKKPETTNIEAQSAPNMEAAAIEAPVVAPPAAASAPLVAAGSVSLPQSNAFVLPQADNHRDEGEKAGPPSAYLTVTSQDFLDTQEQAEFYASIGEYDEAIALLQNHIQSNGNASPLPYLKLLEFFYQLSRADAFEATRQALEAAFNIQAPRLDTYHQQGADLLEGATPLLAQIEALWPTNEVLPLLGGAIHYPTKTPQLAQPLDRLPPAAFQELLLLYEIAERTAPAQRGSTQGRSSTIAAAQQGHTPAATPIEAVSPAAPALDDNFIIDSSITPAVPPAVPAALPPAVADELLPDFTVDWPLPGASETTEAAPPAAQADAEPAPAAPSFNLDGLDFADFEFNPDGPKPPQTP